jgi:cytochrome c oxidase subunit 3
MTRSRVDSTLGMTPEQNLIHRASDLQERVTNSQSVVKRNGPTCSRKSVTATATGLAAVLTFFAALVSAFVVRKGSPAEDWQVLMIPPVFWLNTTILLSSGGTLFYARRLFGKGDRAGFRHWWAVTAILGCFFVAGQLSAWRQLSRAGINLGTNPSSSFLYLFTAAHAALTSGGVVALLSAAFLSKQHLPNQPTTAAVALYWHCTLAIWIGIFLLFLVLH